MNYDEIIELLKVGEGYTIEFKARINESLAKDICAFANASGGKIILGIDDKTNKIKGFQLKNESRSIIQNFARNIDPSLLVNIEQINNLVIIYVPEGKDKPYFVNGKCYLRQGANSQKLTRNEIRNFFQKENLIRFDRKINIKFNFNRDFNQLAFNKFIKEAGIDQNLSKEHILKNLDLVEDGKLTNTGVLFFSKSIHSFFLNSIISCVLYQGTERTDIIDKEDFDLDFITNLEKTIKFLLRNLRTKIIIKDLKREEKPEIPKAALRELILNAMVHRDYFSEGRILIEIFKNRIEISNPGGLII